MSLFRDLDVYKGIVLASILLIPASIGFAWWMEQKLVESDKAIADAVRRNGDIEQIGVLRQNLETVRRNTDVGSVLDQPRRYFEQRIMLTAESGLSSTDFSFQNERSNPTGRQERAVDLELPIEFQRAGKPLALSRDFIRKMLKNCETGGSQVWKLRRIELQNVEAADAKRSRGAPPKTVGDDWFIRRLVFARRQPDTSGR